MHHVHWSGLHFCRPLTVNSSLRFYATGKKAIINGDGGATIGRTRCRAGTPYTQRMPLPHIFPRAVGVEDAHLRVALIGKEK